MGKPLHTLRNVSAAEIRIPDRLLDHPKLDVMVVAGSSQADGHPWVQATVLLVSIETGKQGNERCCEERAETRQLR